MRLIMFIQSWKTLVGLRVFLVKRTNIGPAKNCFPFFLFFELCFVWWYSADVHFSRGQKAIAVWILNLIQIQPSGHFSLILSKSKRNNSLKYDAPKTSKSDTWLA